MGLRFSPRIDRACARGYIQPYITTRTIRAAPFSFAAFSVIFAISIRIYRVCARDLTAASCTFEPDHGDRAGAADQARSVVGRRPADAAAGRRRLRATGAAQQDLGALRNAALLDHRHLPVERRAA